MIVYFFRVTQRYQHHNNTPGLAIQFKVIYLGNNSFIGKDDVQG